MTALSVVSGGRENKFIALVAILYTLMHGGIFFIPFAIYWDDWALVDTSGEHILGVFRQAGSIFNLTGYVHYLLMPIGVWIYKALTFLLMGGAGFFLNAIIKRNGAIGQQLRWCVVMLFLLMPFNMARVALIDFPYAFSYFLFFGAWLLIDRHRLLAAALFFVSFNINSLLVFFAIPVFDLLYRSVERYSISSLIKLALTRWELLILPFLFFAIKIVFYKPTGFYAGYNEGYSLALLPSTLAAQARDLYYLECDPLLAILFLPFICVALSKIFSDPKSTDDLLVEWKLVLLGAVVIFFGVFPYWILGYAPTFEEWSSRHQLLMPLGVGLVVAGIVSCFPFKTKIFLLSIIICSCLSYGIKTYHDFYIDWEKQLLVIDKFKADPLVLGADLVVVDDRAKGLNAIGRTYRFYEWNGMLVRAFGDERRFAIELSEAGRYANGEFDKRFNAQYKAGDHVRKNNPQVVFVELDVKREVEKNSYALQAPAIEYKARAMGDEEWKTLISISVDDHK